MGKAFMWTFVGFCLGLAVVELTNGVPAKKVNYNRYEVRHRLRLLTILHSKEQNHGELKTDEIFTFIILDVLCSKYYE